MEAHLTGSGETVKKADGSTYTQDTGWKVFWAALEVLTSTGLVESVGHLIEADTEDASIIHPYSIEGGEPGEREIARAAFLAASSMVTPAQLQWVLDNDLWMVPVRTHIANVQLIGIARLRYRAHTSATAAWLAASEEWREWAARYTAITPERPEAEHATSRGYQG